MHPIYERRPKRAAPTLLDRLRGPSSATLDQPATPGERVFATLVVTAMVGTALALMFA